MIRVLSIFGTRPEAIKMAPVVHALEKAEGVESLVCVTAQHRDMLDQVLGLFQLTPDDDLDLMQPGQNLHDLTARVVSNLRPVLMQRQPDVVLVHGDTTTSFGAALASFYCGIPIGHVEAGLRTGDLTAPFPEEGNRLLVDRLTQFLFAPTQKAAQNLRDEGLSDRNISVTGNTVIDALLWMRENVETLSAPQKIYGSASTIFENPQQKVVLVTGHRRESFGAGFEQICQAIKKIAIAHPDVQLVYPVHLNPKVQEPVYRLLSNLSNVHLIGPLDYQNFVRLMDRATIILTDSGGIQEEAPSLKKPTLVMRDQTERPEGVTAGVLQLVGTDVHRIFTATHRLLTIPSAYADMTKNDNPYGDGKASQRIVETLRTHFTGLRK